MKKTKIYVQNEFSQRLYREFQQAGLPMHSPTQITRILNRKAFIGKVTTQAVRKWLFHGVFPSQDKILNLAGWLGVSAQWLRYGIGSRTGLPPLVLQETYENNYQVSKLSLVIQEISLLPEANIDELLEMINFLKMQYTSQEKLNDHIEFINLIRKMG